MPTASKSVRVDTVRSNISRSGMNRQRDYKMAVLNKFKQEKHLERIVSVHF